MMDREDQIARMTPSVRKWMAERTGEVRRLFDPLLAAAADQRPALAASEELHNLRLADLLLEESLKLQPAEPLLSEELARLGFQIAIQPHEPRLASRADDARARAAVLIGSARRLMGDRAGAEEAFRCAVTHLTCPPDSLERGFYCRHLAALRRDQGREEEAMGLLWRAVLIYSTARKAFIQQDRLYDAAFASLDLVAVLAPTGWLEESLHSILHDVVEGFRADVRQIGVLRVLGSVESALLRSRHARLDDLLAAAAERLRRYRRNPWLVFEGMTRTWSRSDTNRSSTFRGMEPRIS